MALQIQVTLTDILIPKGLKVSKLLCELTHNNKSYPLNRLKPILVEMPHLRSKLQFNILSDGRLSGSNIIDLTSFFQYQSNRMETLPMLEDHCFLSLIHI